MNFIDKHYYKATACVTVLAIIQAVQVYAKAYYFKNFKLNTEKTEILLIGPTAKRDELFKRFGNLTPLKVTKKHFFISEIL